MFDRRAILRAGGVTAAAALFAPRIAFAAPAATDRRFIFVIQRGAADGLDTLIPYGDPGYARLRAALAIDPAGAHRLDGLFALHPALPNIAALYRDRQALFVHAVASPYRDRSHFDGQNVLETGGTTPYAMPDGWLNRLAGLLPSRATGDPIAFAPTIPTALRGKAPVTSYAPSALPDASDDLLARVSALYAADAQLHPLWSAAMQARAAAGADIARADPAGIGRLAAGFLARADGPRIAMVETGGWDTHSDQASRLGRQLANLDTLIDALRTGLGPAWAQTVLVVATEFGRTAAANGTGGTDHGTAAVAMLLGGAVRGGRIRADWPGLAPANLYEDRDLRPTLDLDALLAGAAAECFGLDPVVTRRALFGTGTPPVTGLIA
ncbi:MAG TPA: DUF1501 domain-containing protein [Sphingomonas sp.]|uniref:DUF1501 domain-containing protein n=1 Tax=Sphingomonas sp. TaxID=28214 RepID=UPI002ED99E51